jgi:ferrous iron transport protein B
VELKEGTVKFGGHQVTVVDLPGTYSLSAYSLEERVARDYLVETHPDVVVQVVDATNLERHLYLTVQLLELGVRPVLALNMWDEVRRKGLKIDIDALSHIMHLPVVTTVGRTAEGIEGMLEAAVRHGSGGETHFDRLPAPFAGEIERAIRKLTADERLGKLGRYPAHWVAAKLLENDAQVREMLAGHPDLLKQADSLAAHVERIEGQDTETLIAEARYGFIAGAVR